MSKLTTRKTINYSLLLVSILMIITGYGITKYQLIEKMTFGILQKSEAFSLHSKLAIIFILLIFAHVGLSWRKFKK